AARLDLVRIPLEREEPHGLNALDKDAELEPRIGFLRLCDLGVHLRRDHPALQRPAGTEAALELAAEPRSELLRFGDRAPDSLLMSREQDLLLDSIGDLCHWQPPGCRLDYARSRRRCNSKVARQRRAGRPTPASTGTELPGLHRPAQS